jgi:hypothetical protein
MSTTPGTLIYTFLQAALRVQPLAHEQTLDFASREANIPSPHHFYTDATADQIQDHLYQVILFELEELEDTRIAEIYKDARELAQVRYPNELEGWDLDIVQSMKEVFDEEEDNMTDEKEARESACFWIQQIGARYLREVIMGITGREQFKEDWEFSQ